MPVRRPVLFVESFLAILRQSLSKKGLTAKVTPRIFMCRASTWGRPRPLCIPQSGWFSTRIRLGTKTRGSFFKWRPLFPFLVSYTPSLALLGPLAGSRTRADSPRRESPGRKDRPEGRLRAGMLVMRPCIGLFFARGSLQEPAGRCASTHLRWLARSCFGQVLTLAGCRNLSSGIGSSPLKGA